MSRNHGAALGCRPRYFCGARLRQLREDAGLSRAEVAVAVGRTAESVYLYELGRIVPPTRMLGELAAALGCDPGDFFAEPVGDRRVAGPTARPEVARRRGSRERALAEPSPAAEEPAGAR